MDATEMSGVVKTDHALVRTVVATVTSTVRTIAVTNWTVQQAVRIYYENCE